MHHFLELCLNAVLIVTCLYVLLVVALSRYNKISWTAATIWWLISGAAVVTGIAFVLFIEKVDRWLISLFR